jgi:hypothetical protein
MQYLVQHILPYLSSSIFPSFRWSSTSSPFLLLHLPQEPSQVVPHWQLPPIWLLGALQTSPQLQLQQLQLQAQTGTRRRLLALARLVESNPRRNRRMRTNIKKRDIRLLCHRFPVALCPGHGDRSDCKRFSRGPSRPRRGHRTKMTRLDGIVAPPFRQETEGCRNHVHFIAATCIQQAGACGPRLYDRDRLT